MNKYLKAFIAFILLSALLHMIFIITAGIMRGDAFNYFGIIQADLIFPSIGNSDIFSIISFLIAGIFYAVFLIIFAKKESFKKQGL